MPIKVPIAIVLLVSCGNAAKVDPSHGFTTSLADELLKARAAGMVWDVASITQITDAAAEDNNCPHPDLGMLISGLVEMGPGVLAGLDGAARRQQLEPRGPYEFMRDLANHMNASMVSNHRQLQSNEAGGPPQSKQPLQPRESAQSEQTEQTSCCDTGFQNYCDRKCGIPYTKCGRCSQDCGRECWACICCIECIDACTKPAMGYTKPCTYFGDPICLQQLDNCPPPPPPPAPPSPPDDDDNAALIGGIVGGTVGGLCVIGLGVAFCAWHLRMLRAATPAATGTAAVQGVAMTAQPVMPAPAQPAAQPQDITAALRELKGLLDDGTLTQEEFDAQKKVVLGRGEKL